MDTDEIGICANAMRRPNVLQRRSRVMPPFNLVRKVMVDRHVIAAPASIRRVGSDAGHHFFGYYNKTPWDASGRYLLANRAAWMTADITPAMAVDVGYFDLAAGERYHACDRTTAWNWQMGCQLQWLGGAERRRMIYNVRTGDDRSVYPRLGAAIHDIDTGERRHLPVPVYVVAPDGRFALCVDYRRLQVTHPTIGYRDDAPARALPNAPADDGIRHLDLATGESVLVTSYRALRDFHPVASMERAIHWVSHVEVNPASSRVVLLHRWTERVEDETCFLHRLITMNPDGTEMRLLEDSDHPLPQLGGQFDAAAVGTFDYEKSEYQISHPLWCDDGHVIAWSPHAGSIHYHLYTDDDRGEVGVVGDGVLAENGHMSFSPVDMRWLLSDTYPDATTHERILFVFDTDTGRRHDVGSFYADPGLGKENRCDLHPRWRADGTRVCIDSVHENARQMYIIDVSQVTAAGARQGPAGLPRPVAA
jgi:hypothetical protein